MVKKQALAVLILIMSFVGSSFGLGLGDIKVNSNLNDPLEAEIKVIQLQGLTSGEILPTLASNDDFRRAGVERNFFLSNIEFRVKETASGEVFVTLTTKQVVREPFLNFLVEVNWPGGRLLKEYTILLDPPVFDTGLSVDALVVENVTGSGTREIETTTILESTVVQDTVEVATTVTPRDDTLPSGEYRVKRNDTLWEIAMKVPGRSGYSPQQVMLAIQDLNADAFLNSNINRVKAGSVLILPDESQIALRSFQEAIEEVRAQNEGAAPKLRAPADTTTEAQLSATDSTGSALESAGDAKNPDGYLELSADSDSGISGAGEISEDVDQLLGQLSIAEELNDQYIRERDDLESKVTELQAQIEIMERLLDVQNSGIAEVQQAIEQTAEAEAAAQAEVDESAIIEPMTEAQPEANAETVQSEELEPIQATPPMPVKQDFMWYVNEYTSLISDWVMKSTTNMAITGGGLLLLLLIPFYIRSKRSNDDDDFGELDDMDAEYDIEEEDVSPTLDEDLLAELEDDFEEEVEAESEQIDAVMEAEMYMAYQKYDQAEEKLKEAFADYPGRADIGLKLMEVYAETGNVAGFNDVESRISLTSVQQEEADAFRSKLPADQLDSGSSDDDFDFDLNSSLSNEGDLDLGSDFDFDLDSTEQSNESPVTPSAKSEDLSFDLDLTEDDSVSKSEIQDAILETDELSTDLDFSLDLGDLDDELSGDNEEGSFDLSIEDEVSPILDSPVAETETDLDFTLDLDDEVSLIDETPSILDEEDAPLDLDIGGLDLSEDDDLDLNIEDNSEESFDIDLSEGASLDSEDELDPVQQLADTLDSDADLDEDEFDFLSGTDEISTKLDLARAYIEMDDKEGARDILDEVIQEGSDEQKSQATALIQQL